MDFRKALTVFEGFLQHTNTVCILLFFFIYAYDNLLETTVGEKVLDRSHLQAIFKKISFFLLTLQLWQSLNKHNAQL